MNTVLFLILFPIVVALLLLILPQPAVRKVIVVLSTIILTVASVYLVVQYFNTGTVFFNLDNQYIDLGIFAIEIILAVIVIGISLKYKQYLAGLLMLTSAAIMIWFEGSYGEEIQTSYNLFVDNLSLIMTLIIGIISSLIAVFAIGYMKEYHHHKEVKDRTPFFFFVVFVFLGAMYGVVFANNLMWLYFFWEITTFSSFFLIGYSREEIAVKNAFRALNMNLLGGLGFSIAIVYLFINAHTIELNMLPELASTVVLLPTALLAFAGMTKSAQMPFSSWLLGAMVAPTPVSALLHSSTMIKAGVYLIIRLSPVFAFVDGGSMVGLFVAMVGAVTFVLTAFMAISQSDAKRVLAYSTISNLGLIIVCAGIGTYQLMWAAIMLMIFHAIAKSLLFLSVGTVEHNIGDRIIESMDGLITKMPKIAIGMVIGIAGMFLAPFGMLISKWAALEGLVTANPVLTVFVAFGSAATLFFWTKWLGKLLMVKERPLEFQSKVPRTERFTLTTLAVLTVGVCLLFPLISKYSLEPFIASIYNQTYLLDQGNVIILLIMVGLMVVLPVGLSLTHKNVQYKPQYLAGLNTPEKEKFYGSLGLTREITMRSFYLENIFGESKLFKLGVVISIVLIIIMFGVGII
ncbi:Energy-conserving hydrogenase (ferredoxin), subunit A [Dehalobacter sp. UNSWDHB]|jgi:NADH:ubiquinone oxidoreductase subunit 5 (chain L)/Multisubunit Na+/H+ antiporter, MnhA subunit|uniref:NADH-quinone oxidoreductase subunit 5 family protein n=1 Tax=unclassified Dehalobacter TaxID=2635733 RepID=UPI00028AD25C|nr:MULTISPECIES: proton-conducting transporter membrane subunit [unclassified Dehalobacter]AFV01813.1 Energy-conserving hydrogenase (ferredoxin), subunit A [Dehalobacter sp. DCA]AFV04849.1 Energy-conserving hydrogenase (ferredoxin), subunit A [Dehalobacter sp. CF]EQB21611.1 Energy-conserving hydrogenase (ferredoxin), subunit A [Dehalobacter sp. UNSWDHB]